MVVLKFSGIPPGKPFNYHIRCRINVHAFVTVGIYIDNLVVLKSCMGLPPATEGKLRPFLDGVCIYLYYYYAYVVNLGNLLQVVSIDITETKFM